MQTTRIAKMLAGLSVLALCAGVARATDYSWYAWTAGGNDSVFPVDGRSGSFYLLYNRVRAISSQIGDGDDGYTGVLKIGSNRPTVVIGRHDDRLPAGSHGIQI